MSISITSFAPTPALWSREPQASPGAFSETVSPWGADCLDECLAQRAGLQGQIDSLEHLLQGWQGFGEETREADPRAASPELATGIGGGDDRARAAGGENQSLTQSSQAADQAEPSITASGEGAATRSQPLVTRKTEEKTRELDGGRASSGGANARETTREFDYDGISGTVLTASGKPHRKPPAHRKPNKRRHQVNGVWFAGKR